MNIAPFVLTLIFDTRVQTPPTRHTMDGLTKPLNTAEENAEIDKLKSANKSQAAEQKSISKTLDGFRRLVQIATAVTVALLLMAWFVDHPALASSTKTPALGALVLICLAYLVALELAHGRTGVIMFLIISGSTSAGLSAGYAICWLHHHM